MTDPRDLADRYVDARQATEALRLLAYRTTLHLDRWEDLTATGIERRREALLSFADEAEALLDDADPEDRTMLETIAFTARSSAQLLRWRNEQTLVNPAMGLHTTLFNALGRFSLSSVGDGERYLAKLHGLPAMLDQLREEVVDAADEGRIALGRHLRATAETIDAHLARPVDEDDPLARQPPPSGLDDAAATAWRAAVVGAVEHRIRPALARYADDLARLAERGRSDEHAGIGHVAGGDEVYRGHVWAHTSTDLSPEEIHRIGLDVIAGLEDEYREIAGPLLGTTEIGEIFERLRTDPTMKYDSADDLIRDATEAMDRARAAAPAWFHSMPEAECIGTATPNGALAFYSPPDPSSGNPARFSFNTSNLAAWSTYQIEAVAFHEAIPGHHFQFARFIESSSLHPAQVRFGVTAYLEGWGLYTERLADEMGLYSSDLARVGMLAADSMRACRLVVDTGMHALGWSRQAAIDFMIANSPLDPALVEGEIDRYIGYPGQALSYMIGRLEIDRLRADAQQRNGFDIAEFHEALLGNGMVTLPTLRRIVLG
jgi:uncharacterized protein (DUF885 family)